MYTYTYYTYHIDTIQICNNAYKYIYMYDITFILVRSRYYVRVHHETVSTIQFNSTIQQFNTRRLNSPEPWCEWRPHRSHSRFELNRFAEFSFVESN